MTILLIRLRLIGDVGGAPWEGLNVFPWESVNAMPILVLLALSFLAWMPARASRWQALGTRTLAVFLLHGFVMRGFRAAGLTSPEPKPPPFTRPSLHSSPTAAPEVAATAV